MPDQTLSPHILEQLPRYVVSDYETFSLFLQAYYEWMETSGNVYDRITSALSYRDIDRTLTEFVKYFEKEFLIDIPTKLFSEDGVSVNKATLVKHIKEFYQARGTEKSYKLLFRILFNEDVEFYYPKVDMLYVSDGKWTVDRILRCTSTGDTFSLIGNTITGQTSGATAAVENVFQFQIGNDLVSELYISNVVGTFIAGEGIESGSILEYLFSMTTGLTIVNGGTNYRVGDPITIVGGGANATGAEAIVDDVRGSLRDTIQIIDGGSGYNDIPDVKVIGTGFGSIVEAALTPSGLMSVDIINASSGHDINDPPVVEFVADEITVTLTNEVGIFEVGEVVVGSTSNTSGRISDYYFDSGFYYLKIVDMDGLYIAGEEIVGSDSLAEADIPNITPYGASAVVTIGANSYLEEVDIISAGIGYTKAPNVRLRRPSGSIDTYAVMKAWLDGTTVASVSVIDAGRDYTSEGGLSVIFSGGQLDPTNSRHAIALAEISGQISKAHISNPGIRYNEVPSVVFAYASGTGASATATIGADFSYPGKFLNTDGFVSSDKFIQDSFYYQVYSYVLRSTQSTNKYRDVVNRVLHPAGLLLFGTTILTSFFQIGPAYRGVEGEKFRYMPNEEFIQTMPAPNAGYWSLSGYANTQIDEWKDVVIGDVIDGPLVRVDNAPDVYLYAYNPTYAIPQDGNVVEYDFVQRILTQQLYDIGPNPEYPGVLGNSTSVDINDPTWVGTGLEFDGTYVNCSAAPVNPLTQSIVVVAKVDSLNQKMSLLGCIDSDNPANCTGYRIDVDVDGSLVFRTQKRVSSPSATHALEVSYPAGSVTVGNWFFAVLRYADNTITGNLNTSAAIQASYLFNVESRGIINNTKGYYIGNQGFVKPMSGGSFYGSTIYGNALYGSGANSQIVYTPIESLYNESLFGEHYFNGNIITEVVFVQPVPGQPLLDGIVGYTIIYDRYILEEEIDAIYNVLKVDLAPRPIILP